MEATTLRRWLTVGMLLTVTLVALLGVRTVDLLENAEPCQGWLCVGQPGNDPAGTDHVFPLHDPCLHDSACGGGAALGLGGMLLAVIAARVLLTPASRTIRRHVWALVEPLIALVVGGVERPPRFAR